LAEAMVAAWQRGERPLAEAFLANAPEVDDEIALRLIFEEFCLRQEAGLAADPAEFAARFPRLWPDLELLLDCQRLMEAEPVAVELPEPGDEIAGFRLIRELGRGILGKVFLAAETALADRPVVVKIAPIGRSEHLSLARLQHMSIVPLYSARVLHERSLQVLCMPFLGGASLAQVLELLKDVEPSKRTGSQVVEAIDRVQTSLPVALEARGPLRRHLARLPYAEAIAWVGLCLAEGLRYAHERDFVHMDIKPSNVLLTGDGQPMLLDFHLAREPIAPGDPPPDQLGGTPGYMAPEQVLALDAAAESRAIPSRVDGRADLFSLGAILDEALGGEVPAEGRRLPLHRRNPRVSVGLSDLVAHCLEPDPASRYPDAASLAADLRRFLDGLPLRGVANRSVSERWRNWRRRSPHALTRAVILAVAVVVVCSALGLLRAAYLQRVGDAEAALEQGRASLARRQFAEASKFLTRGQAIAGTLPETRLIQSELTQALDLTRRLARADELHRLAELVRFRYGIDPPPPEEARSLIARGQEIWSHRKLILKPAEVKGDPEFEPIVQADLLDFTLAWVNFRVRLASIEQRETVRTEALQVLDELESLIGPLAAIDRERANTLDRAGSTNPPVAEPRSAREHFDLGQSYLRSGATSQAAEQFRLGLLLRPQDFWLNFYQGLTAYRLEQFDDAANAFRVAIALAPDSAECYYNRALAMGALGRLDEAIGDYTRALELNPGLGVAAMNRGILHYRSGRLDEASRDLKWALSLTSARADLGRIRYNLGLVEIARGDRTAGIVELDLAAGLGDEAARTLRDRLRSGAVVKPD
jgi:serine/threonine protein kinase/tetratricopeptide (TPR) repeat protein